MSTAKKRVYTRANKTPARATPKKTVAKKRVYTRSSGTAIKGKGAYKQFKAPKSTGSSLGSLLGGWIGHGAQHLIKSLVGFGDYQVEQNSLMPGLMSPPEVVNSPNDGGFIVRHREYLGDINATVAFASRVIPINPGLPGSFPWLSGVAENFEEYQFRGLVYEFKSLSSDSVLSSATSSALGSVIMSTQYNALLPAFASKLQMENYEFANSSKPSCSFYHPIECKQSWIPLQGHLYVRTNAVQANADVRLYDMGNFQISTIGMQAASGVCGEVWCTYEIILRRAKFDPNNQAGVVDHLQISGASAAAPLGTTSGFNFNTIGGVINFGVGTIYTFPSTAIVGNVYKIYWFFQGNTGVAIVYPVITLANCVTVNLFVADTLSSALVPVAGTTSTAASMCFHVRITGAGATITWGTAGTLPGIPQVSDMFVEQILPNVV